MGHGEPHGAFLVVGLINTAVNLNSRLERRTNLPLSKTDRLFPPETTKNPAGEAGGLTGAAEFVGIKCASADF